MDNPVTTSLFINVFNIQNPHTLLILDTWTSLIAASVCFLMFVFLICDMARHYWFSDRPKAITIIFVGIIVFGVSVWLLS